MPQDYQFSAMAASSCCIATGPHWPWPGQGPPSRRAPAIAQLCPDYLNAGHDLDPQSHGRQVPTAVVRHDLSMRLHLSSGRRETAWQPRAGLFAVGTDGERVAPQSSEVKLRRLTELRRNFLFAGAFNSLAGGTDSFPKPQRCDELHHA